MDKDFKNIKGNKVHKTAIINWEKIEIGKGNIFYPYSVIGSDAQHSYEKTKGKLVIGNKNIFREFCTVNLPTKKKKLTKIGNSCIFMTMSHIGHDCTIEDNVVVSNNVNIAGNTYVMKNSQFGLNSVIHQDQVVGSYCMIGMGTIIGKKILLKPGYIYVGNPPKGIILNKIGLERNNISKKKLLNEIKRFEKLAKYV